MKTEDFTSDGLFFFFPQKVITIFSHLIIIFFKHVFLDIFYDRQVWMWVITKNYYSYYIQCFNKVAHILVLKISKDSGNLPE